MRPFFIVGVMLIGLLVLYWALQHIGPILSSVQLFWVEVPANAPAFNPVWNMITKCVSFLVAMAFALFLLFRGQSLASLVPLPEPPIRAFAIQPEALLRTGVVLAGLLVACNAVPKFAMDAFVAISTPAREPSVPVYTVYGQSRLVESGIQLVLAWLLLFRSAWVARVIGDNSDEGQTGAATAEQPSQAPREKTRAAEGQVVRLRELGCRDDTR